MENLILSEFETKAKQAHNWTSFSPERRGEQMISEYSEELNEDIEQLKSENIPEETISEYVARYKRFFSSYLSAKGNCFSIMITGGGNFPVRRHEKANRSERRHYEVFREWRERAKKAIVRKSKPKATYLSELDRYKAELESMKQNHVIMKEANKRIKQSLKDMISIDDYLIELGVKPHMIEHTMRWGFGLTNNNANMKRAEQRIKELEAKETLRQDSPEKEFLFEGGKIVFNYEIDRIQVYFNTRPSQSELAEWKQKGLNSFNWSPSNMAWQRKITPNAIYATKKMVKTN